MARKKPTRKKSSQSSTSLAKRQRAIIKVLSNKKQNQSKDLTFWQKIGRYRKWFPFGIFSLVFGIWVKNWPQKLEVSDRLLGKQYGYSNAIIIKNPNSYMIENISIDLDSRADLTANNGTMKWKDVQLGSKKMIFEIDAKKTKHVLPNFTKGVVIDEIEKCSITIIYSFETPFYYPNIKNDTISYTGFLNQNGEVEYLPN